MMQQGPVYSDPNQMPQYNQGQPYMIPTPAPDVQQQPNLQPQDVPQQTPPVIQEPGQPSLGPDQPVEPTAGNWQQSPYSHGYQQVPATAQRPRASTSTPDLMGPIGYDVE